jgi:hypothetical protein
MATRTVLLIGIVIALVGCANSDLPPVGGDGTAALLPPTMEPALSGKLQRDVELTAQLLLTLTPPATATQEFPALTALPLVNAGIPMGERTGLCPIPEGYVLQELLGFCLSTPAGWALFNIDGGMAGKLNSTPGQAISIQPGWAGSLDDCSLIVYIAHGVTLDEHLTASYVEFSGQPATYTVSSLGVVSLGSSAAVGFNWESAEGSGGVFAAPRGLNRIVHVSYGGTLCPAQELVPVIETLRFN